MHQHGYIGRKMRLPKLQDRPAIVIAVFGSSSRAKAALDLFAERFTEEFPEYEPYWAYTSEIIRKKAGLPSLQETLAQVEAAGYRKVVVQPLHIFPGTEYQQMAETCAFFPGLRVFLSETLLHRWDFIKETLAVLEQDFLAPAEGWNLLALHGTPLAADPVNIVYLGLERLVGDLYPNVLAASIEGVPDHEAVLARIQRQGLAGKFHRLRIIPMMYFAGMHAEEDLMGESESWRATLTDIGFTVECSMACIGNVQSFKGLACYPEILTFFMERLRRALILAEYF
ncbi:MAG: sirohydrochlorin cobaltochelatase [Proteobacteria bacterium]|nr:cobalamin biosynthesis protein CbiK [Desulfocapsa sp.]MBU3945461.1 sirohydrochlorin cobaltochelatase [Pseudomonadota bacterium]MBU4029172.1 sirohydrochlorin cobaltochelatase [Pseudomonadota bacterium]MBU4043901.1 sirohydrochlorin cobaltochelatase [Pseudomonadota bacterium]MBU4085675.1 sirohydrochlorin cobaltochelatase [Pseudomonadota bacterium]